MRRALLWSFSLVAVLMFASDSRATVYVFSRGLAPEAAGATGGGFAEVRYDDVAHTLLVETAWHGLSGVTTVAHIHAPTAVAGTGTIGVAVTPTTFPGFPAGTKSGSYSVLLDLTLDATYTAAFRNNFGGGTAAGAELALFNAMQAGQSYLNIHSTTFTGGEIRGFLLQQVPEPSSIVLMGLGAVGVGFAALRSLRKV